MSKCKQLNFVDIVLICIFMAHDMPIIGYKFPAILYAVLVLVVSFILFSKIGLLSIKKIIPFFLIPLLNFIVSTFKNYDLILMLQGLSGFLQLITYTMVGYVIFQTVDLRNAKRLLLFYAIVNVITCITTIYGCVRYPGAARALAVGGESEVANYSLYALSNIGGFSFVYTMVLTLPVLIYWFRNSKFIYRFISLCIIVLLAYLVVQVEYTIALLIFLVLCSFLIISQKNIDIRKCVLVFFLSFLAFETFSPLLSDGLQYLASNVESKNMADRLNDLSLVIINKETTSNESDLDLRSEDYNDSLNTFFSYPFGCWLGDGKIGGHSYLLDNLAKYGLLGFYFIWIMLKLLYTNYVAIYKRENIYNYALIILFACLVLMILNTKVFYIPLTFTLPLSWLIIEGKKSA